MIIFFDFISLIPIVIYFSLIYNFLINPLRNIVDLFLFIYILATDYLVKIIKHLNYPEKLYKITRNLKSIYYRLFIQKW